MARALAQSPPILFARDEAGAFVAPGTGAATRCGACGARVSAVDADLIGGGHFVHVGADCGAGDVAGLRGAGRQALRGVRELLLPRWLRASHDYMDRAGRIHRIEHEEPAFVLFVQSVVAEEDRSRYKSDAIIRGAELPEELHVELKCNRGDNVDSTALRYYFEDRRYAVSIDVARYAAASEMSFAQYVAHRASRDWLYHKGAEARYEREEQALLARYAALMEDAAGRVHLENP